MPKPQISELITAGESSSEEDRAVQAANLAGSRATEATMQAAGRAVRLHRFLRDKLGLWINDGIKLKSTSDTPYVLEIAARNDYRDRAERTHTEVKVIPGGDRQNVGLKIDTTEPLDQDPAATLTVVNPETGEEYPVTALDPTEQDKLPDVMGQLGADIERRLEEGNFEAQPLSR